MNDAEESPPVYDDAEIICRAVQIRVRRAEEDAILEDVKRIRERAKQEDAERQRKAAGPIAHRLYDLLSYGMFFGTIAFAVAGLLRFHVLAFGCLVLASFSYLYVGIYDFVCVAEIRRDCIDFCKICCGASATFAMFVLVLYAASHLKWDGGGVRSGEFGAFSVEDFAPKHEM